MKQEATRSHHGSHSHDGAAAVLNGAAPAVDEQDITAGEFFSLVLLSVLPTTLHNAINEAVNSNVDIPTALEKVLKRTPEDKDAAETYRKLVKDSRYDKFFAEMKQKVNADAAAVIRSAVSKAQTLKWIQPPHPGGTDVTALLATLKPYVEKNAG
jgi:hypothetical protein